MGGFKLKVQFAMTFALMSPTVSAASGPVPAANGAVSQWHQACSREPVVTERIGAPLLSELNQGARVISEAGLADRLGALSTPEGCLTLAASAASGIPSFTLIKPEQEDLKPTEIPGLEFQPLEAALKEKMAALDLGYFVPAPGANPDQTYSQVYSEYPEEAISASWTTLLLEARMNQRSFASQFQGYCLIIHDASSFDVFIDQTFQGSLADALTTSDRQWLGQHGSAIEFWHEVAECKLNPLAARQQPQLGAEQTDIYADATGMECDANSFAKQIIQHAQGNRLLSQLDAQLYQKDITILYLLGQEVFADEFALHQTVKRFQLRRPGCKAPEDQADEPWKKFRLTNTAANPDIQYMTWLAPFLADQPISVQAQVLSDAWAASKTLAFDEVERPIKPSMTWKIIQSRREGHWYSPTLKPDDQRRGQWVAWLKGQLAIE